MKACNTSTPDGTHVGVMIFCPGCEFAHVFDKRWKFNGDMEKPTFTPSYLSKTVRGPERTKLVCHSFVTDGKIRFLSDCTHKLKGQTVELPDEFE